MRCRIICRLLDPAGYVKRRNAASKPLGVLLLGTFLKVLEHCVGLPLLGVAIADVAFLDPGDVDHPPNVVAFFGHESEALRCRRIPQSRHDSIGLGRRDENFIVRDVERRLIKQPEFPPAFVMKARSAHRPASLKLPQSTMPQQSGEIWRAFTRPP